MAERRKVYEEANAEAAEIVQHLLRSFPFLCPDHEEFGKHEQQDLEDLVNVIMSELQSTNAYSIRTAHKTLDWGK